MDGVHTDKHWLAKAKAACRHRGVELQQNQIKKNRVEAVKNGIIGGLFGIILVFGLFYLASNAAENRDSVIFQDF